MNRRVFIPAAAALCLPPAVPALAGHLNGPAERTGGRPAPLWLTPETDAIPARIPAPPVPPAAPLLSADATAEDRSPDVPTFLVPFSPGTLLPVEALKPQPAFETDRADANPTPRSWLVSARVHSGPTAFANQPVQDYDNIGNLFPNDRLLGVTGLARFIPAPGPASTALAALAMLSARSRRRANDAACRRSP